MEDPHRGTAVVIRQPADIARASLALIRGERKLIEILTWVTVIVALLLYLLRLVANAKMNTYNPHED